MIYINNKDIKTLLKKWIYLLQINGNNSKQSVREEMEYLLDQLEEEGVDDD